MLVYMEILQFNVFITLSLRWIWNKMSV